MGWRLISRDTLTAHRLAKASRMTAGRSEETGWKAKVQLREDQKRHNFNHSHCARTQSLAELFSFFCVKKGGKLTLQNFERLSLRSVRFCLTLTKEPCFLFSYRHLRRLFLQPTLLQFKPNHECSRLIRVFASFSTAIHSSTAEVHKALQRKELRDTEGNAALD